MQKLAIIYLAAGRGSRLKNKSKNIPKCMVNLNKKSIIDHNLDFLKLFDTTYIVTGYKSEKIKKKFKKSDFLICKNNKYKKTNMVYSAFVPNVKAKNIVICYGDIIFDKTIFFHFKKNNYDFLPVNENWLKLWKERMNKKQIFEDAENIEINKKNYIQSIGGKLTNKLPKSQFMGIINLKYESYLNLKKFFIEKKNIRIDFTNFLNSAIKEKVIKLKAIPTKKYWYEVDTLKDLKLVKKKLANKLI